MCTAASRSKQNICLSTRTVALCVPLLSTQLRLRCCAMHKRDLFVLALSCFAVYFSLQVACCARYPCTDARPGR